MTDIEQREARNLFDRIRDTCPREAKEEIRQACEERGVSSDLYFSYEFSETHLEILREIWNRWHTTVKYKPGDKVYVIPSERGMSIFPHCIRATVTGISKDSKTGYDLRAFASDLPGIFMFNIWDKDLLPRVGKAKLPVSKLEKV